MNKDRSIGKLIETVYKEIIKRADAGDEKALEIVHIGALKINAQKDAEMYLDQLKDLLDIYLKELNDQSKKTKPKT